MYVAGEEKLTTGEMSDDELTLIVIERLKSKIGRYKEEREKYLEWCTVDSWRANTAIYLSHSEKGRLSGIATRKARERGIELKKQTRCVNGIDRPLNVYPKALLDEVAREYLGIEGYKLCA